MVWKFSTSLSPCVFDFLPLLSDCTDGSSSSDAVDNVIISTSLGSYFYDSTRSGFVSKAFRFFFPNKLLLPFSAPLIFSPQHGPIRLCLILPSGFLSLSLRLLSFLRSVFPAAWMLIKNRSVLTASPDRAIARAPASRWYMRASRALPAN